MKPEKLEIMPFGFSISFKLHTKDYNKKILKASLLEIKKIIVAISGPLTNLIIILIFIFGKIEFASKDLIIYSNLLIMLFNLLPIYPLDGGRILKSIVHIFKGGRLAKIITNKVANIVMIIGTLVGSIAIYYYENIAIFIIIMFLWFLVIRENRRHKTIMNAYNVLYSTNKKKKLT